MLPFVYYSCPAIQSKYYKRNVVVISFINVKLLPFGGPTKLVGDKSHCCTHQKCATVLNVSDIWKFMNYLMNLINSLSIVQILVEYGWQAFPCTTHQHDASI